ncbi:hypothetical protein [Marinicella sp. W31]|uniref:hypothetical protein n=1 Tax=Marinicella sp. W31 TaxID=3023713 RepID=UPI003756978E
MHLKHAFTLFVICFIYALPGQTQGNPENGPHHCLLNDTPNCPISFMLKAFCMRDEGSCLHLIGSDTYALSDRIFIRNYSEYLFGTPAGNLLYPIFSVMETYPTATLHEIFEFGICHNDPGSCYPEGANGLTIYHHSSECPPGQRDTDGCQGGPRDSKICQVTPEACSGYFDPD